MSDAPSWSARVIKRPISCIGYDYDFPLQANSVRQRCKGGRASSSPYQHYSMGLNLLLPFDERAHERVEQIVCSGLRSLEVAAKCMQWSRASPRRMMPADADAPNAIHVMNICSANTNTAYRILINRWLCSGETMRIVQGMTSKNCDYRCKPLRKCPQSLQLFHDLYTCTWIHVDRLRICGAGT